MTDEGGTAMKSRLRADLTAAMKHGGRREVAIIRELIAVIDNAEAVPIELPRSSSVRHSALSGSAEVERLVLSAERVRELLQGEIDAREQAAVELDAIGQSGIADLLRADARATRRYIDE